MAPLLELRGVDARYGQVQALHGISLTVDQGEIVALLGANGAGKTTTLRAVSGTVRRDGDVIFADKRRTGGPEAMARAGLAHVPEGRGIFARAERRARTCAWARTCGAAVPTSRRCTAYFPWLAERGHQQAGTLSGGEQQMLALARAFLSRPRLLMLDEPSLGLAPLVTREVFRVVGELNANEGVAVLVVEQNAAIALGVAAARLRPRDRPHRALGNRRRAARERLDPRRVPRLLNAAIRPTGRRRARAGRDLRLARAGARPDLQGDRGDQLRAGRDGDVHDVHLLEPDHASRLLVLAGVLRHDRDRLRRRHRHPARRHPPARAGERADGGDGDDRAARDLQRARRRGSGRRRSSSSRARSRRRPG